MIKIPQVESEYNAYLRAYKALHPVRQTVLRAIARQMLRAADLPEYGSSDVSCQVFNIWKNVGGFSNENFNDILTDLRDEWLGWAALPGEEAVDVIPFNE